jgi:hypothetical protein
MNANALQDHLIDTLSNGQFVDVANRPRSPYFTTTSFLAALLIADGQVVEEGDHSTARAFKCSGCKGIHSGP